MAEARIEAAGVAYAVSRGWLVRKMEYIGRRGCADRYFFRNGITLQIEFKDIGKRPNPQQLREHKKLADHGITVHVVDNIEDAERLLA